MNDQPVTNLENESETSALPDDIRRKASLEAFAKTAEKGGRLIDRYYLVAAAAMSGLVIWLNLHGRGMQILFRHYPHFSRIIASGFDPSIALERDPAFPMWGYGWLTLLTESRVPLLLFQSALALLAVWVFVRYVETQGVFSTWAVRVFKLLIVGCIPWYSFHALRWPYSIAVSLFLVSFVLLHEGATSARFRIRPLLLSGVLFGLALNFRSDFILMPLGLAVAAGWAASTWGDGLRRAGLWLVSIYIMLVPWMIYTYAMVGHALLTSTNGGHVMFIGLGDLPENKWGIIPSDGDPVMHSLLEEEFGPRHSSLSYASDQFLKREFLRRVSEDPAEYLRKCLRSARNTWQHGVYAGEFFETSANQARDRKQWVRDVKDFVARPISFTQAQGFEESFRNGMQLLSQKIGQMTVYYSYLLLPVTVVWAFRRRNLFWILLSLCIAYQTVLQVLCCTKPTYTANMLFFHLMNLVGAGTLCVVWADGGLRRAARFFRELPLAGDRRPLVELLRPHRLLAFVLGVWLTLLVVEWAGVRLLRQVGATTRFIPVRDLAELPVRPSLTEDPGAPPTEAPKSDAIRLMQRVMNSVEKIEPTPQLDAEGLIEHVSAGGGLTCGGMAVLLHRELTSAGIPSRLIRTSRHLGDPHETHMLVEARVDGQWCLFDPTFNVTYERDGKALGATDVVRAIVDGSIVNVVPNFHGEVDYPARIDTYYTDWRPLFNNVFIAHTGDGSLVGRLPPFRWWWGPRHYYVGGLTGTGHLEFYDGLYFVFAVPLPMVILVMGLGLSSAYAIGVYRLAQSFQRSSGRRPPARAGDRAEPDETARAAA